MQRLPRLVELLLIIVLCGVVALWATRVLRGAPIVVPSLAPSPAAAADGRLEQVLASARLFGSRRPGVLSDNVRALGVVADETARGSVIVSIDGQPPKVYRVGDTLDGRQVIAIRPDEIELEAGGARQTFRLPAARASVAGVTVSGVTATGMASGTAAAPAAARPTPEANPYAAPPPSPQQQPQPRPGLEPHRRAQMRE